MGCGEVVNTRDFDSRIRWFKSNHPSSLKRGLALVDNSKLGSVLIPPI